jgi:hypothetical protein
MVAKELNVNQTGCHNTVHKTDPQHYQVQGTYLLKEL